MHKFRAKSDFVKYFSESRKSSRGLPSPYVVQLYLPPNIMINKDFLKAVLADQKQLLKLSQLRCVSVPKYDELSVKNIFPIIMRDGDVMQYFPDTYPKGRHPDREYTFNVLNSVRPEYVAKMIAHAQSARNACSEQSDQAQEIVISRKW